MSIFERKSNTATKDRRLKSPKAVEPSVRPTEETEDYFKLRDQLAQYGVKTTTSGNNDTSMLSVIIAQNSESRTERKIVPPRIRQQAQDFEDRLESIVGQEELDAAKADIARQSRNFRGYGTYADPERLRIELRKRVLDSK